MIKRGVKGIRRRLSLLLVAGTIMGGFSCNAQTHYHSNVALGVKVGAETSQVFFNPSVNQGWPFSPTAGVMFRYIEENHFGLIAELNYVRRGWSENFDDKTFHYRHDIDYLEVPVLAHIYFGRRGKFFVNLGPEIAFKIGDKVNANFDPSEISSLPGFPLNTRRNEQLTEPVIQKVDYGITAGLGGEFNINRRNSINIEARYYFGIGNIFSSGRQDNFRASNQMSILLTVGYWFRIK